MNEQNERNAPPATCRVCGERLDWQPGHREARCARCGTTEERRAE